MFSSILESTGGELSIVSALLCTLTSLACGAVIALVCRFRSSASNNFLAALILLPVIVQIVIMMVNGEVGTGVAVMGAFSLVRFRSVPGNAKDICCIFFAMAIGLATGMGYLAFAISATVVICAVLLALNLVKISPNLAQVERELRITVPEELDYTEVFDDLFEKYTVRRELIRVKTTNMGSLFELKYRITMRSGANEKAFIDEIRCRNANLAVMLGHCEYGNDGLIL